MKLVEKYQNAPNVEADMKSSDKTEEVHGVMDKLPESFAEK